MASILNRYESIMAMNVCGMVEFSDEPLKMVRHLMHHMEDDQTKTRREGEALLGEMEKLEKNTLVPNGEALLAAKKAEWERLQEINERLTEQIRQLTEIRVKLYYAQRRGEK